MSVRTFLRVLASTAIAALPACSTLVGADFDHSLRPAVDSGLIDAGRDASVSIDGSSDRSVDTDQGSDDAVSDVRDGSSDRLEATSADGVEVDGRSPADGGPPDGGGSRDAGGDDGGLDVDFDGSGPDDGRSGDGGALDGGDGGLRPTVVKGSIVFLGAPSPRPSSIELRGQIISNANVRGTTANGITIQGRLQ
jgi:hypothetical protein